MTKKFILRLIIVISFVIALYLGHSVNPEFIEFLFGKLEFLFGELLDLLRDIAWPVVIIIIFVIFRRQISDLIDDLIDRMREFKVVGSTKFKADTTKIDKVKQISQEIPSEEEVAKQLLEEQALEDRELRILRALVGEPGGRHFYTYKRNNYYSPALDSLAVKSLIFKQGNKYLLTPLGTEVVKLHMAKSLGLFNT